VHREIVGAAVTRCNGALSASSSEAAAVEECVHESFACSARGWVSVRKNEEAHLRHYSGSELRAARVPQGRPLVLSGLQRRDGVSAAS
jgi:hypothetical protein